MSDLIPDVREMEKMGDLNALKKYLKDPGDVDWTKAKLDSLHELYKMAESESPENPLEWCMKLNSMIPAHFEFGTVSSRVEKLLTFIKTMRGAKAREVKQVKPDLF